MKGVEDFTVVTVAIPNGESTSGPIDFRHSTWLAVEFPAAFTGATVAIHTSFYEDGTYVPLVDQGGVAVTLTKALSSLASFDADPAANVAPCGFIKLVSASAEGAARSLRVYMKS